MFGGTARAWVAAIRQEATDWMEGSARNEREHIAAKVVSSHGPLELTGYFSYDDIDENNYQRLYAEADFRADPRWDRLIGHWPGVPYLNQFYRRGWETRRRNTLAYLSADWSVGELTSLSAGAYHHRNRGRGDWLPPYIVDVVNDGEGPESELAGLAPVRGGSQRGVVRFVDGNGVAVGPIPGCTSSYIFNYYGSGGPEVDPACHPGATAVQSFRHSHYGKDRVGANIDAEWSVLFGAGGGSASRAGIWYEDSRRHLGRDWHRMLDPTLSFKGDEQPYWHQYEWDFPQDVFRWYVEETLYFGPFELTGGVKQFLVSVSREDQFGIDRDLGVDSDSDPLFSGGVTYGTPVEGLDLFVGYAENFRAIGSTLLEVPGRSLDLLEPETASNTDVGVQYAGDRLALSATLYPSISTTASSTSGRKRPQAPITSFRAGAPTSTRAESKPGASSWPPRWRCRIGRRSTPPSRSTTRSTSGPAIRSLTPARALCPAPTSRACRLGCGSCPSTAPVPWAADCRRNTRHRAASV